MKKRWFLLFFSICLLLCFCACSHGGETEAESLSESIYPTPEATETPTATPTATEAPTVTATPTATSTATATPKPTATAKPTVKVTVTIQATPTPTPTPAPTEAAEETESQAVEVAEKVITDRSLPEPDLPAVGTRLEIKSAHTAVAQEGLYQYASMSEGDKALYRHILSAIREYKSVLDLEEFSVTESDILWVFDRLLSDHPEFFYLSESCAVIYSSTGSEVRALVLLYTDGSVTDEYNSDLSLKVSADRGVIEAQVKTFVSLAEGFLATLSPEEPAVIKERRIHDYICKLVTYDQTAADNSAAYGYFAPHSFDAYGALAEGKAVCEGYAKLFSFLCIQAGIPSTTVYGIAGGTSHMWSCVCIDGGWYQTDVTWDDGDTVNYDYFNLTDREMGMSHRAELSYCSVPVCAGSGAGFADAFAVRVSSLSAEPAGYEQALDNAKLLGDTRLFVYFSPEVLLFSGGNPYGNAEAYLQQVFFTEGSAVLACATEKGISFSPDVEISGSYFVIPICYE